MKIAAVIVLYNFNSELFSNNLSSYYHDVEKMYLVDNSDNFSSNFIADEKIEYIKTKSNLGIASALNIGIHKAIIDGFNWALTMDQDSYFVTNINGYKDYITHSCTDNIIILAPQYKCHQQNILIKQSNILLKEVWQSGNLLNLNLFAKNGDFLDSFFIDYVDYEYCYRARFIFRNQIVQCNSVILQHNPGLTNIGHFLFIKYHYQSSSPLRFYYQIRNGLFVVSRYRVYKRLWYMFKGFVKVMLLENNKIIKVKYMLLGAKAFFIGKFGAFNEEEL